MLLHFFWFLILQQLHLIYHQSTDRVTTCASLSGIAKHFYSLSHILMHVPLYPQSPIFLKFLLNAYERQGFYYSQCVIIGLKLIKKYASMDMLLLKSKDCCQREQTIQEYLKTKHETVRPNFSFFLSLLYLLSKWGGKVTFKIDIFN